MTERKGILVAVGEENAVRGSWIKIYDLAKMDRTTHTPMLLRSAKVQPSNKPHPVSCFFPFMFRSMSL